MCDGLRRAVPGAEVPEVHARRGARPRDRRPVPDLQDADPGGKSGRDTRHETRDTRDRTTPRELSPVLTRVSCLVSVQGLSSGRPRAVSYRFSPAATCPRALQKMSSPSTPTVELVQNRT